jgi:hypothetical protein
VKRRAHIVRRLPERPTTAVEEIQIAVDEHTVSFSMVMKALYLQRPEFARDEHEHVTARYRELYPTALAQFMESHEGIQDSFYAERFPAGVVLTGSEELFVSIWWEVFAFDTTAARELDAEINELRLKIGKFVSPSDRRGFVHRSARLYEMLIASLDVEYVRRAGLTAEDTDRAPSAQHLADIAELHHELDRMWLAYHRVGATRGQAIYIGGAVLGVFVIVGLALGFWIVNGDHERTVWPAAAAGGAVGALFSVLERQTRGALDVRFESESLIIGGISRPIVGTIAAGAMYALVAGGILPLDAPPFGTSRSLFFAAVAFLSGFSERFAKDAFGSAAHSLTGDAGDDAVTGSASGSAPGSMS